MTNTTFENSDSGNQNLKVKIGSEFKEYSSWPNRVIENSVNEPDFPDPLTDFSQLTSGAGWILA